MVSLQLVKVGHIKQNENTIGSVVEKTGNYVKINPQFIAYVETIGDGDAFPFYLKVTMSDKTSFSVDLCSRMFL